MAKVIAMALTALLLAGCAGSVPPSIPGEGQDYWKGYGRTHGADANGG